MKERYENLNLVDFFPDKYSKFEELVAFINRREEGDELSISKNCILYMGDDAIYFSVVYDDIRTYKGDDELDIRSLSDEEVLEWVIDNLEELSEAEDEMFEDELEDGDIEEVGMGWFADSQ